MVTINIEKKYVSLILSVIVFLAGIVLAVAYTQQIPNPGHGGDQILVSAGGEELTLQSALDQGKFSSSKCTLIAQTGMSEKTDKTVSVPDYCKNSKTCYLYLIGYKSSSQYTVQRFYSQNSAGYFDSEPNKALGTGADDKNGDSSAGNILRIGDSVRLLDDLGSENSADSWTLRDQRNDWRLELYSCPAFYV